MGRETKKWDAPDEVKPEGTNPIKNENRAKKQGSRRCEREQGQGRQNAREDVESIVYVKKFFGGKEVEGVAWTW